MDGNTSLARQPSTQQLAQAMRAGLENRRWTNRGPLGFAPSASFSAETRNALNAHFDLLAFPPIAKPGLFAPPLRLLRRAWKALIRPWLGVQTEFNRLTVEIVHALHQESQALDRKLDECRDAIDKVYSAAVNRELGHDGKIGRAGLWFNPPISVELQNNLPVLAAVSERILETIFVHTRLPPPPAKVLDLGCAESTCGIEMASFGYEVTGVDLRRLPIYHPRFAMTQSNAADLPFPDASFDVAVSLSTIEHIGLDWYAPINAESTDHGAMAELLRVLKPGGRLLLTVPFGRPVTTRVHRVYDSARLDALLQPFRRVETLYGARDENCWSITRDGKEAERMDSAQRVSAVALVVAERP